MNKDFYCIIMAGGIGSRFFPISSEQKPKQFIDILDTGKTLIQQTYSRFLKIIPNENIFVVTSDIYFDLVKQQIPNIININILCEPQRRNTAPCILYAALKIRALNENANVVVAPSDHLILDENEFLKDIIEAFDFAEHNDSLITLGITPNRPATGYGYIQFIENQEINNIYKVQKFTEKPNLETAKQFLKNGNYFWNAGIFIWKNINILRALQQFTPDIYNSFISRIDALNTQNEKAMIAEIYAEINSISVDYAVLEKAKNVYVKKTDFAWSDLGTWNSLYEIAAKDNNLNVITGTKVAKIFNSDGNYLKTTIDKTLCIRDLNNFIVIDTEDVLVICKRENENEIKKFLEE